MAIFIVFSFLNKFSYGFALEPISWVEKNIAGSLVLGRKSSLFAQFVGCYSINGNVPFDRYRFYAVGVYSVFTTFA
jgi:hypothetical protein